MDGFAECTDSEHGAEPVHGVADGSRRRWGLQLQRQTGRRFKPELSPPPIPEVRKIDPRASIAGPGTRHDSLARRIGSADALLPFEGRQQDAVEALDHVEGIAVFFFRRDGPQDGEGSSGIRWLDAPLLGRVLLKLEPNGLFVTDGARMTGDAPQDPLWKVPALPAPVGVEFEAYGRSFRCESVFCRRIRPAFVWREGRSLRRSRS
jgi:hypothetical protein